MTEPRTPDDRPILGYHPDPVYGLPVPMRAGDSLHASGRLSYLVDVTGTRFAVGLAPGGARLVLFSSEPVPMQDGTNDQ